MFREFLHYRVLTDRKKTENLARLGKTYPNSRDLAALFRIPCPHRFEAFPRSTLI